MVRGKLTVDPRSLRFRVDDISFDIPLNDLRLEVDPNQDGRIYFIGRKRPDVKCFTQDESILDHWAFQQCNHVRMQLRKMAGRSDMWRRVKLTLVVFAIFGVGAWLSQHVISAMVRTVVQQVPAEWERKFGDQQMVELGKEWKIIDDTNRVAQLAALAEPLTRTIPGKVEFKFHLIESYMPNALALPGGHVAVTTGLLGVVDRPEQLLGVIAHEVAHVTRKHGFQQAVSGAGPVVLLKILLSDRNNRMNLLGELSGILIYQSFSQSFEHEADETGWDYLVKANVDPRGLIEMFEKFKADYGGDDDSSALQAFHSHPALSQRILRLQAKWEKLPQKSGFVSLTNEMPAGLYGNSSDRFNEMMDILSRRSRKKSEK